MRIPVFSVDSATGWGLTNESKRILGDWRQAPERRLPPPAHLHDRRQVRRQYTCSSTDKANSRVARIRLDIMKCDQILTVPNVQAIHGLRLQKVRCTPSTCSPTLEFVIPHPNDGHTFDLQDNNSFTMFNAIDAEKMEMAFQVVRRWQPGSTPMPTTPANTPPALCYNSEKAYRPGRHDAQRARLGGGVQHPSVSRRRSRPASSSTWTACQGAGDPMAADRWQGLRIHSLHSRAEETPTGSTLRRTANTSSPTARLSPTGFDG